MYLNLVANRTAQVEIDGRRVDVSAAEVTGDEAASWWLRILELSPDYERYTRAARRSFPVLRLTPT